MCVCAAEWLGGGVTVPTVGGACGVQGSGTRVQLSVVGTEDCWKYATAEGLTVLQSFSYEMPFRERPGVLLRGLLRALNPSVQTAAVGGVGGLTVDSGRVS